MRAPPAPSRLAALAAAAALLAVALAPAAARAASASCSAADGACDADAGLVVLVASATATTGQETVRALSAAGVPRVRAMVRRMEDARAVALGALRGVEIVVGDFENATTIRGALAGVSRCLLVSGAFSYQQFEHESLFLEAAAAAGVEVVVRIGTTSTLTKAGTKGAYGRAHHGIEAFAKDHAYPVVTLHPSLFASNFLSNAAEAKASGLISLPVPGNGPRDVGILDPRDVGSAAAAILTLPAQKLAPFIAKSHIELHGPKLANLDGVAEALSRAAGYEIKINSVAPGPWVETVIGLGIPRVFATSFLETMQQVAGVVPSGYECYGPDGGRASWPRTSDALFDTIGWAPRHDLDSWAASARKAFARD